MQYPSLRRVFGIAIAVALWGFGTAQAAPCTVSVNFTNPDATLTNSTSCGPGIDNNDTAALVNTAEPSSTIWSFIDRDQGPTGTPADAPASGFTEAALSFNTANNGLTGNWFIDAQNGLNAFLIVLKDGETAGTNTDWFWFIVDTSFTGCSISGAPAGTDFCGTWSMYGVDGVQKQLSHMTLYGAITDGTIPPGQVPPGQVAEPATLMLLGFALVGLAGVRRKLA